MKIRSSRLSVFERREIAGRRQAWVSPDGVARRLGRQRLTIFRELRRNRFDDTELPDLNGGLGLIAQGKPDGPKSRQRKLVREGKLRERVEHCLSCVWTPEQIAGRMQYEDAPELVCHEEICLRTHSDEGRKSALWRHLPSCSRRRRGHRLRKRPPRGFRTRGG